MSFWKSLFGGGASRERSQGERAGRVQRLHDPRRALQGRGAYQTAGTITKESAGSPRSTSSSAPTAMPPMTTRSSSRSPRRARSWTSRASGCSAGACRRRSPRLQRKAAVHCRRGTDGIPMKHVLVLLNARAGTLIDAGTESIVGQIEAALKPRCDSLDIRLLQPRDLAGAIAEAALGPHDTVIVGGGDGSASAAVAAFSGGDKMLGVLPFGTMNLFARDLGMPADLHEAIAALATVVPRRIDLAEINGRPFHTLSGLGFFSQMARAREEMRGHPLGRFVSVVLAWFRALRRTVPFTHRHRARRPARAGECARRARHQQPLRRRLAAAAPRRRHPRTASRRGSRARSPS